VHGDQPGAGGDCAGKSLLARAGEETERGVEHDKVSLGRCREPGGAGRRPGGEPGVHQQLLQLQARSEQVLVHVVAGDDDKRASLAAGEGSRRSHQRASVGGP
jgi:hypothetical protein